MSLMDPQSTAFTPRDDLWAFKSEMLRVQQIQADHADRLARIERRQDEDTRVRSVWASSASFPNVLSGGTPQQAPLQDTFSGFDDQPNNLLSSLHLDAEDEPRRLGATSRANSVRFDETANQGHWSHASRSSIDLIPRTGSGLGGHVLTERSYSHKSDGRQSSAGVSVHSAASGRANSLGLDTTFGLAHSQSSPEEAPVIAPGLFVLGPVPSIIRCWLNTDFKHNSLLYAVISSASYSSFLDLHLIAKLGYTERIFEDGDGQRKIKLEMYLPEAVPHPASSRPNSPAPQVPSFSITFFITESQPAEAGFKPIQVFIGSDVLRAHNADILFSSNTLTLFDDEGSKLSIPLVRPEDDRTFKSFHVSGTVPRPAPQEVDSKESVSCMADADESLLSPGADVPSSNLSASVSSQPPAGFSSDETNTTRPSSRAKTQSPTPQSSSENDGHRPLLGLLDTRTPNSKECQEPGTAPARTGSSPAIWSNWRRDNDKGSQLDWGAAGRSSNLPYQRKETGMKVLRPMKAASRTSSTGVVGTPSPSTSQSRFFDDGRRKMSVAPSAAENGAGEASQKPSVSGGSVSGPSSTTGKDTGVAASKPRSSNPIGSASAFGWLAK